jgi:PAS domain S-box-containing protein
MTDDSAQKDERKKTVKDMIKRLHGGEDPGKVREEHNELLKGLAPHELGMIEQELIAEGMPREEVQSLCDVHIAAFMENAEKSGPSIPDWHPVHILMEEHTLMTGFAEELREVVHVMQSSGGFDKAGSSMDDLQRIVDRLKDSESHYLREENVLFPHLEKHGITEPPAIMWMEHDKIREIKKGIYSLFDSRKDAVFDEFVGQMNQKASNLVETVTGHFYKENNILFPMGLNVIETAEWKEIRKDFDDLGYTSFTPDLGRTVAGEDIGTPKDQEAGRLSFETGNLSKEEIESILNTLPVDITFVDSNDEVQYFSGSEERIFVRTKSVIGRSVQQCHPQKSIDVVNQILEDFKRGKRDKAEFWINLKGRLVYIRYFPVRNPNGNYIGCLEVTQDITDVKGIEGEKRLLDG